MIRKLSDYSMTYNCPICEKLSDEIFRSSLPFCVRSDWTPIESKFHLFYCDECDHLFKDDETVINGCDYESYELWGNEKSGDKIIFENGLATVGKSEKIFDFLNLKIENFEHKSVLDFGCQRGAFLSQIKNHGGSLAGLDVSEKYREAIEGLGSIYYGPGDKINKKFDVMTLIHVLEHLVNLKKSLVDIKNALENRGNVFIQVPDVVNQPTDIYVIDHKYHFSKQSLLRSFRVLADLNENHFENLVPGELTSIHREGHDQPQEKFKSLTGVVSQLLAIERTVRTINSGVEKVAVYGAGMLGSLFFANMEERVSYFVDDDPKQAGKTLHGRPIYSLSNKPNNIPIVNCLPFVHAKRVSKNFKNESSIIDLF